MIISIIDVGTQSIKHYIFDVNDNDKNLIYYKRYSEANLGESDIISKDTIERNIKIISECVLVNKDKGVEKMEILGTEILRRAENSSTFIFEVRKLTNKEIKVVSHDDEAKYLYQGFIKIVPDQFTFGAINIGGGSTELVIGDKGKMIKSHKIPFGVKAIRSSFAVGNSVDWNAVDQYLDSEIITNQSAENVFVTGVLDFIGTVGPHLGFTFDNCDIPNHPIKFNIERYIEFLSVLRKTDIETLRSLYTKDPMFADNFAIGQSVYAKISSKLNAKTIIPSNNDMTDGVLFNLLNSKV